MASLREATTNTALCALEYDNFQVGPKKRWSILASERDVHLSQQDIGSTPVQTFAIPRKFFDQLIDAYTADQGNAKAKTQKVAKAGTAKAARGNRKGSRGASTGKRSGERALRQTQSERGR